MANAPRPLIAGNWKMNGTRADLETLAAIASGARSQSADAMICPPATLLASAVAQVHGSDLLIGAQDCHAEASGAHTGDVSAEMIADVGAKAIIVGHSERRSDHGERDRDVAAKANACVGRGLIAIVCVGETAGQRAAGLAIDVALRQMRASLPQTVTADSVVVAYEPVWAIGTGLVATIDDIVSIHTALRDALVTDYGDVGHSVRLLYGGSVKPGNAAEILSQPNVNGALVGGASLKADDFLAIVAAA